MTTTQIIENTLFLAYNEDGDVVGDMDRDAAIERIRDDFGGEHVRVIKMAVKVPVPRDPEATLTIPEGAAEEITVATE